MRIVYMGTPDFAVPCLQKLYDLGHEVCGVFCQPDKPQGRKMILTAPPVKEKALELGLPVFQPAKMRDGEALSILQELNPELIVVVAYGKILPKEILELPPHGCINIHASLLPALRGAAPIQWSVINGCTETGVTAMQMDEGLDTGDMLLTAKVTIGENETADALWDRLSLLAPSVLEQVLTQVENGTLQPVKQDDSLSSYAPMLCKEMAEIDWNEPASVVHNKIRGFFSWPCAFTVLRGKRIKLLASKKAEGNGKPGEILVCDKRLIVACGEGAVEIVSLQAEGKKAMDAADYLRGAALEKGMQFFDS